MIEGWNQVYEKLFECLLDSVANPRNDRVRGAEDFYQELFGKVVSMIEQGRFQRLG